MAFKSDSLILGCDTKLWSLASNPPETVTLCADTEHDRLVALLAVAGRGRLAKGALSQLAVALEDWRRGERAIAAIRLAFARLPRVRDLEEAHTLFLAETALDAGLSPNDLLKALGYAGCLPLLKDYRIQPRVPAGCGPASGQWTCDASGISFVPDQDPSLVRPIADGDAALRPIPVFLGPQEDDAEAHGIEDKWRRLGLEEPDKGDIEHGRPLFLPLPVPGPIGPEGPGFFADPWAGQPKTVPGEFQILPGADPAGVGEANPGAPRIGPAPGAAPALDTAPKPAPGGGGTSTDGPPREEDGPACPEPENDRPRGPNVNADTFEYAQSKVVNPLDPTPKWSPDRPSVRSLAYYLKTLTPDGKTSYDDCKKDNAPIAIPEVRRGDMFEFKSKNAGWPLYYSNSEAFEELREQIRRQNEGVIREARGRRVFYCWETQALANQAYRVLHQEFPNSRFLKCD